MATVVLPRAGLRVTFYICLILRAIRRPRIPDRRLGARPSTWLHEGDGPPRIVADFAVGISSGKPLLLLAGVGTRLPRTLVEIPKVTICRFWIGISCR